MTEVLALHKETKGDIEGIYYLPEHNSLSLDGSLLLMMNDYHCLQQSNLLMPFFYFFQFQDHIHFQTN